MTEEFTWNCCQWLEENFFQNNGLPYFFVQGKYTYINKEIAFEEYKNVVYLAANSENISYSKWSKMIANVNFSVLQNKDVKDFWTGMLDAERRDGNLEQYNRITFINQTQEQYANPPPVKRKSPEQDTNFVVGVEIEPFEEMDSVHVEGMEESIATWIGREGRMTTVVDRKSRYFNCLGMNGVLDLSDTSKGSQMSKLSADIQGKIRQLFPPPHITTPCIEQRFEEIQNELRHTESKNGRYFKRYLEKLEAFKSTEKYKISKKLYTIILDLMLYDSYIFDPTDSNNLSEGDYVVKVWGPLLETLFRGSGVILHWGDTVPENIKAENKIIKMDLRIINSLGDEKSKSDIATAEIAKNITPSKFYKDKLKTMLSSKADINEIISSLSKVNDSTVSIYVPFIIIAELEATVCALHLGGNGLYVINEVTTISLPTTLLEVKNGGILTAVNNLYILKKLVVESNDIIKNIAELETVKKRKTLKNLTSQISNNNSNQFKCKDYIRPVWFPVKFNSDTDDA